MTLASKILAFQRKLKLDLPLPQGVNVMNPYQHEDVFFLCKRFYEKFYDDKKPRTLILGINPGRHGGGITGIPFTDPIKLAELGIENDLPKKRELSADFIYRMIGSFGGPRRFYREFYFSSISPLGFTQDNRNLNYYDAKALQQVLDPFIVACLRQQLAWGLNQKKCFCLGEGKNVQYLKKLNDLHHFFHKIVSLPHPRFIMQYRRKSVDQFVARYITDFLTE